MFNTKMTRDCWRRIVPASNFLYVGCLVAANVHLRALSRDADDCRGPLPQSCTLFFVNLTFYKLEF